MVDEQRTDIIYLIIARYGSGTSMKMSASLIKYNGPGNQGWLCDLTSNGGVSSNGYSVGAGNGGGVYNTSLNNIEFYSILMW